MCGRFTLVKTKEEVAERFRVTLEGNDYFKRYNAAPGQQLPIISDALPDQVQHFQWGLIPAWAKDEKVGNQAINARMETVNEKPSFQHAFEHQRCLVIADGYYEWKTHGKEKIPYRITLKDAPLFAMAGLWEKWTPPKGKEILSFTIITKEAEPSVAHLHERMPVILSPIDEQFWLSDDFNTTERLELLQKPTGEALNFYTVGKKVSNVRFDTPDLIHPVNYQVQGSLF